MRDPVSKNLYKKSVCLMHNFSYGSLDSLFVKRNNTTSPTRHQHGRVEGYCQGYGSRSSLSQVYPFAFCKKLALCLISLLKTSRHPRNEERQTFVIDDILSISEITVDEAVAIQELYETMDKTHSGFSTSIMDKSTLISQSRLRNLNWQLL